MVLAASRCGDAFSIDALIRRRRGNNGHANHGSRTSGDYTWPIKLVCTLMTLVFFAAGVAKLRKTGLVWIFSDNMRNILLLHYYTSHEPLTRLGVFFAKSPWLYKTIAASAIIVEVGAPAALFSRIARWTIVPTMFLMLVSFKLCFGFTPIPYYCMFAYWIPWDHLGQKLNLLKVHDPTAIETDNTE